MSKDDEVDEVLGVARIGNACHTMVRDLAVQMAGSKYEDFARNNTRYHHFRKLTAGISPQAREKLWISKMWPCFVEDARAILATMLRDPTMEALHEQIAEALIADNSLRYRHSPSKGLH